MRIFYKLLAIMTAFLILLSTPVYVNAEGVSTENPEVDVTTPMDEESTPVSSPADLQITSKSAILVEQTSGEIIYEHNSHERLSPASVTKIMSLILIMEAIERGDFSYETEITASPHAVSKGGSQIWLKEGEVMTVDDLLKATVIASANDATTALAEAVAGSEETFVALMNERARQLGMNDTEFKNCTGLDAEGHLTSAYDIAVMSRELLKHPKIIEYSTVWMDTIRDGKSELVNTNKLVRFYEGTTGLKTGTTSKAGYCLSASAKREGVSFIAVVMDAPSSKVRFNEARTLLSFGFANYTLYKASVPENLPENLKVKGGTKNSVGIKADGECSVVIRKADVDKIQYKLELPENLTAEIKKGNRVGSVKIILDGAEIGEIKIIATEDVSKMSFRYAFLTLLRQMAVV